MNMNTLLRAMKEDGMSGFWCQLVVDGGPRGTAIAQRLWATMPERYRSSEKRTYTPREN